MRFPTATLGEERALAAVREGAAHYILKDPLQRLVSTVKRALGASAERPRAPPLASVARLASGIAHDVTNVRPPILLGVPLLRAHITAPRRSPAPRDIRKKRRARRRPRPPDPLLRPGASAANPARSRSHRSAATSARSPAKPFPPTSAATPASAPTFGPSPPAPPKSTQSSSISASPPATPCAAAAPSPSARKTSSATTSPCAPSPAPAPAQRSCGRSRTRAPAFCPTCSPRSGMLATRPNKMAKAPAKPPTSASPQSAAWSPPTASSLSRAKPPRHHLPHFPPRGRRRPRRDARPRLRRRPPRQRRTPPPPRRRSEHPQRHHHASLPLRLSRQRRPRRAAAQTRRENPRRSQSPLRPPPRRPGPAFADAFLAKPVHVGTVLRTGHDRRQTPPPPAARAPHPTRNPRRSFRSKIIIDLSPRHLRRSFPTVGHFQSGCPNEKTTLLHPVGRCLVRRGRNHCPVAPHPTARSVRPFVPPPLGSGDGQHRPRHRLPL